MSGVRGEIVLDRRRVETAWWGLAAARAVSASAVVAGAAARVPSVMAAEVASAHSPSVTLGHDEGKRPARPEDPFPGPRCENPTAVMVGAGPPSTTCGPEAGDVVDGGPSAATTGGDEALTLVFLHEGLGCIDLWRDVPETLSTWTGLPAFAYSRLGYGQSDPAPLPWPPSYMHDEAALLPRILDAAGITRAILIGHSDGGSIATIHAATGDPRILALITIAAHFFVEDLNLAAIRAIRDTYATTDLRARLGRYHRGPDNAFHGWNGAWLNPDFRAFDITDAIARIRAPILGLQGADDPYGTEAQLAAITDHARVRAETRLIETARHAPHLEARNETLAAITGFILDLPT